jgi:hypothetical protein
MRVRSYLLSLPERLVRSTVGLGAGIVRELGELALPDGVRRGRLYQNLVDATLRYLIEQVGGADGVYTGEGALPPDFIARRTAGNAIEVLGIVAFRASPVWVLAALADVCGAGRQVIPEITQALNAEGLLEPDAEFRTVDELLDGLERTSARLAAAVNTPPLDVAALRTEWQALRDDARTLRPARLPSRQTITGLWSELTAEAARQERSIFETSSLLALSAASALPDRVRWLSASGRVGAKRAGQLVGAALLDHYRQTLDEMRQAGYASYAARLLAPYVRAAAGNFSPARRTLTERLLDRWANRGKPEPRG